jgi:aminomethyltransferase
MSAGAADYHLALRDIHREAGATFRRHAGWWWPASYGDTTAEHAAIREGIALFDRSPRSRVLVTGTDALDVLRATFAGHLEDLDEGRALRTVRLDTRGEIRDIVLVARTAGIAYLVSGEPGQRSETIACLREHVRRDYAVRIEDRTESTCLLGIAGPGAAAFAREHLAEGLPARLQVLHCVTFEFHGFRALGVRASDTGEDGFELMLAPAVAQHLVETLVEAGARLAGLDAQEIARVESCIPAFDPDLATGLSPGEAELDTLLEVAPGRTRWALAAAIVEGAGAATGDLLGADGEPVGQLRSVVPSPSLRSTIALAVVEARHNVPGRSLDAGGARATIVAKPFYRRRV